MKILDIKLSNFQGIASMEISLGGKSASIFGDNGTGKTTIFNAITWLLFDKPSTGAKNWTPKTRGADGEKHNLEHSVTATFVLQDGSRVTLGKTLREVYKKKRGSTTAEYTGNTVDYFLDGVPVKEKEYTAAVSEYCGGEQIMKLLTMPDYFPETMEWKKRRELLLEICGDVSDDDVIESNPDLRDLPTYLIKPGTLSQFYTVEEYSKIAKARKTDINRQLDAIPGRIDEAQRAISAELPAKDVLEARLHAAAQATEEARRVIADIRAGAGDATRAVLAAAKAELAETRANYTRKNQDAQAGVYEALAAIDKEIREAGRRAEDARAEAGTKRRQAERLTRLRESILAEYREAAAVKFDAGQETCPTCGRRLPEDQIEAMRGDFNQKRAERLAAINERGRREANKDMIAELEAQAAELDKRAAEADAEAQAAREKRESVSRGLASFPPFEETTEYKALADRIAELEREEAEADKGVAVQAEQADARLQECLGREHDIRGQIIQVENAARQRARVEELEAQEKQLAEEYEKVERGVYLCEVFVKTKVSALTDRINSKFRSVSFQLFTEQVNGGLSECCEVLVPSEDGAMVPYTTANHAARVNAGLEIVATIAEHFDREMPVFLDNAEGVQKIQTINAQLIQLIAPPSWEKLGEIVQKSLIVALGSEEKARTAYEAPTKVLRVEVAA